MQLFTKDTPVGEWVSGRPDLIPFLEEHQIDYCCGGDSTLADACHKAGIDPDVVMRNFSLARPASLQDSLSINWSTITLTELCDHIEETHHHYLRETLPYLEKMLARVRQAHSSRHPELAELEATFHELCAELIPHMMKEEQILFPAIRRLEEVQHAVSFPFGSVRNPITMMEHEHDQAGAALRKLRELTDGYRVPEDACGTYSALINGLENLEADLHQHIHKENNILFPRAAQLEVLH